MKRTFIIGLILMLMAVPVSAFLYEIEILSSEQIRALSDKDILDLYTETKIEEKASATFHGKAGFMPKEYNKYKDLLRFIIHLRQDMTRRGIEVPPLEEWLS